MFLNTITNSIFIILGEKCNLHCKYCIQNKYKENNDGIIDSNIYDFIKNISLNQKEKINIVFYGGEPFLYFDNIKEIVKNTLLYNVCYKIITNGILITNEIINFANKYNITIAISWDGKNTKQTRYIDVFENENFKNQIFKINNLTINSVLSAKNYPLEMCETIQDLANEYIKINNKGNFNFHFEELVDNNIQDQSLINFDYNRIKNEIQIITENCKDLIIYYLNHYKYNFNTINFVKFIFIKRYLDLIKKYNDKLFQEPCETGISDLAIDIKGNLYFCQDSNNILGNINNLSLKDYKIKYCNLNKTKIIYNTFCKNCYYYPLCYTGCKLMDINTKKKYLCNLKKAISEPIYNIYYKVGRN